MDTAPEPFLLLEPEAAPRLEAVPALLPIAEPVRWLRSPTLAGVAILGLGVPVLWAVWLASCVIRPLGCAGVGGPCDLVVWDRPDRRGHRPGTARFVIAAPGRSPPHRIRQRRGCKDKAGGTALAGSAAAALCDLAGSGCGRHAGNSTRAVAFGACASAAGCNGGPRTERRSSERRDRRGDPFAGIGRTDRWLVRCAADTADRSTAWDAPGNSGDTGIAAENCLGRGVGCRSGDRRERRHSCDGLASAVATPGGRRRRRRSGSPPHDRVGSRSRSGLFTNSARLGVLGNKGFDSQPASPSLPWPARAGRP